MLSTSSNSTRIVPHNQGLHNIRPAWISAGTGTSDWKQYATKHAAKVKSRVRKGIPDRLRGVAWQLLSGGRDLLLQNEGTPSIVHIAGTCKASGTAPCKKKLCDLFTVPAHFSRAPWQEDGAQSEAIHLAKGELALGVKEDQSALGMEIPCSSPLQHRHGASSSTDFYMLLHPCWSGPLQHESL